MLLIFNIQIDEYKNLSEVVKTEWCSSQTVTWARVACSRRGGLRFFLLIILSMYTRGPLAIKSKKNEMLSSNVDRAFLWENNNSRGFMQKNWPHAPSLPSSLGQWPPCHAGMPSQRSERTQSRFAPYLHARAKLLHQFNVCHKF